MVIYITGHTRGLGKHLYDSLKNLGNEVYGFSSTSGCDLKRDKFYEFANRKSNTEYLLLGLTSSSYKDDALVLQSILFWLSNPNIIEIGFNIDE